MRKVINFNYDWEFKKKGYNWEKIDIPHTINIEKLDEDRIYRDKVLYRKFFELSELKGQQAFLEFEGVMIVAKVYINGKFIIKHEGGYTPFVINLTPFLKDGRNEILLEVDNREKRSIPPGRPVYALDFLYYSGIYRNVNLIIVDSIFVTNAIYENQINGGGIYIETKEITDKYARVTSKINISNKKRHENVKVITKITYNAATIDEKQVDFIPDKGDIEFEYIIKNAKLWSPDTPNLYKLHIEIYLNDVLIDEVEETFGIRIAEIKKDGFYLNGKCIYLSGTNRHQQFPYIGIAASDEAQYRDAYKIKESGANIIRLSHYAQSPAFYRACDELGIIVINQVPGWQYCKFGKFRKLSKKNIQVMMRRDRNHACHLIMETGLNETVFFRSGATDKFFQELVDICKAEGKIITYGSPHGRKDWYYVNYDMISAYWNEQDKSRTSEGFKNRKSFIPEYGDFEFGGHYSSSRCDRADGEKASLIQAWNFQWSYNKNLYTADALGQCTWESIDHTRGYDRKNPISKSGIMDIFRREKFVYSLYASQKDIMTDEDIILSSSVFNYTGQDKIIFYSNCEKIALYDKDEFIKEQLPDNGEDNPYIGMDEEYDESVMYWTQNADYIKSSQKNGALARHTMSCIYNGGNCKAIAHPPFTFTNLKKYSNLIAKGYINNKCVKEIPIIECKSVDHYQIDVDYSGKYLVNNGNDFVFVHIKAMDENNTIDCNYFSDVTINVSGGRAIYSNTKSADAGIATFMIVANKFAEKVEVSVKYKNKKTSKLIQLTKI